MSATPFDPTRHLSRISGSDYLEVKWRLVWLRDQHPDATIATELVKIGGEGSNAFAIFKATIGLPSGGNASGYGSETAGDFRDFIEKAETKAVGRALAALGYGTQFSHDYEFGAAQGRVVDAPVAHPGNGNTAGPAPASIGPDQPATPRQLRYLQAIAREAGFDMDALNARSMTEFGVPANQLTRRDASTLIDVLPGSAPPQAQPAPATGALSQQVKQGRETAPPAPQNGQARPAVQNPDAEPSAKQWEFIDGLARAIELDRPTMDELAMLRYGTPGIDALTKGEASNLIDAMRQVRDGALAKESLWPEKPAAPKTAPPSAATGAGWDEPSPWDNAEPPF